MKRLKPIQGFTLIELLMVIGITMLLVGMVAAAGMVIMQQAHRTSTQATILAITQALTLYRDEDPRRRFPPDHPYPLDQTIRYDPKGAYVGSAVNVASMLMRQGLAIHGEMLGEDATGSYSFLVDAWNQPFHYQVDSVVDGSPKRPLDSNGQPLVLDDAKDWNPAGVQPYAYLWSCGRPKSGSGTRAQASNWLYMREGK